MRSAGHRWYVLLAAAMLILAGASPAAADCASELTASQKNLERTRAAVAANAGSEAQKCAAQRRYYTALVKVREVFSRCDTGAEKGKNAAQLTATIDDFKAKMPRGCRP